MTDEIDELVRDVERVIQKNEEYLRTGPDFRVGRSLRNNFVPVEGMVNTQDI